MNNLVTIAEVKGVLKIEANEDDPDISLAIGSASEHVLKYLNSEGDEYRDTDGAVIPGNVPDIIKRAVIMYVGIMLRVPDGNDGNVYRADFLPEPVEAMLTMYRTPTLA